MAYIQPMKTNYESDDECIIQLDKLLGKYPNDLTLNMCKLFIYIYDDTVFNASLLSDLSNMFDKYPEDSEKIMRLNNYIIDNIDCDSIDSTNLTDRLKLFLSLEKMIVQ